MNKNAKETMSLAAFARKHSVNRKTVSRWRDAGYVVMAGDKVDVARSEKLPAGRPAVHNGGRARGPTAEDGPDMSLADHIVGYERWERASEPHVAAIYAAIIADLRKLPS